MLNWNLEISNLALYRIAELYKMHIDTSFPVESRL